MERLTDPPRIPPRPNVANKVSAGRVLVVGGSLSLRGAPALAALGALRAGAGLVQVAVPEVVQDTVAGYRPETTTVGLPATPGGALGEAALAALRELAPTWDAVVLGPGAGRLKATLDLMRSFTLWVKRPLVLDADALFAFNGELAVLKERTHPTVITPHEGEAARLLGTTSDVVRLGREAALERLAIESGAVAVLKGPGTLVGDGMRIFQSDTGGPALATGGTGDVLAGVVGAFLARAERADIDAFTAACAAVHVHGASADAVAGGRRAGLLASELAAGIPDALREVEGGKP
jgi:NAD(P)H-hydrate epimerase